MAKLLLVVAGLIVVAGLLPYSTARAVPEQDWHGSLSFFFGSCDEFKDTSVSLLDDDACRGLGLFWGDWDPVDIMNEIRADASDRIRRHLPGEQAQSV